jgi:hypothetical protein
LSSDTDIEYCVVFSIANVFIFVAAVKANPDVNSEKLIKRLLYRAESPRPFAVNAGVLSLPPTKRMMNYRHYAISMTAIL